MYLILRVLIVLGYIRTRVVFADAPKYGWIKYGIKYYHFGVRFQIKVRGTPESYLTSSPNKTVKMKFQRIKKHKSLSTAHKE